MADKIPPTLVNPKSFLKGEYKDSFYLFLSSSDEVKSVVQIMASKNGAGFDSISMDIIKLAIPVIAEPLTCIINNSLTDNQYGFRSRSDTSMAVVKMVDKISEAIDANEYSIGIFIDLSKAFDTLNHSIL